jgi:peptide/nickel transport system substrate-binding protein
MTGSLVETWEMPDAQTAVLRLHQGVHFQDKPPANGRELVADDVVYHYDRMMGTGHGFTEPSRFQTTFAQNTFQSATADDKYTVTIKFKTPSVLNLENLMEMTSLTYIEAPEWSALGPEGINDWHNAVGTGPWILTDYVDGNSMNFVRNPNYWGYDERYPDNQLPYADKLNVICIPDATTALASLRTGQIDILTDVDWKQAETTAKSNPELLQSEIPSTGCGLLMNLNNEPYTEINVRKALQLAIDIPTLVNTYYGGTIDSTPSGPVSPKLKDYSFTYDEWPQELKDEYSYNPDKAKQLLADAGYPGGFNTSIVCSTNQDLQLLQILQAMFADIGVVVETSTMDMGAYTGFIMEAQHEGMIGPEPNTFGGTGIPWNALRLYTTVFRNPSTINDPVMDDMFKEIGSCTDRSKLVQQVKEAQQYALEHHWVLMVTSQSVKYNIYQPYLKGYSGELIGNMDYYARWWLDK